MVGPGDPMAAPADRNRTPPLLATRFPRSAHLKSLLEGQPPIIVFCKSHSGSRLLVRLMEAAGVFMGAHQNQSGDSWDILPIVRYLVTRYYPDYAQVLRGEDPLLADMMEAALLRHLDGYDPAAGRRWRARGRRWFRGRTHKCLECGSAWLNQKGSTACRLCPGASRRRRCPG